MRAKDFRALARDTLRGKWGVAVAVCLVASLLLGSLSLVTRLSSQDTLDVLEELELYQMVALLTKLAAVSLICSVIIFVISGVVSFGLADFFIRLVKGEPVEFRMLFGHFHRIWQGICMNFMVSLFTFLWSLLFIIPGIIAVYRYAMVPYLMAEFPDLGVMDAIRESKRLMHGNKWRFFCLGISFIGWALLSAMTFGIGSLWLNPYMNAAQAAFYMEVTGRGPSSEPEQPARPDYLNSPEF